MNEETCLWESWMKKDKEIEEAYKKICNAYDGIKLNSWRNYTKKRLSLDQLINLADSCDLLNEKEKHSVSIDKKIVDKLNYVLNTHGLYLSATWPMFGDKNKEYSITNGCL